MKTLLISICLFFNAAHLTGQHYLIWEKTGKNSTHGENIFLLNQLVHNQINSLFKPKLFDENTKKKKLAGMSYRFVKFLVIDAQLDYFTGLAQHEAFGHGAYYREYGYENNQFSINLAPPFGNGSGLASRGNLKKPRKIGRHENISAEYGGSESTEVLAGMVLKKWALNERIDFDESILYVGGSLNVSSYLMGSDYSNKIRGDMLDYIDKINQYHGYNITSQYPLNLAYLQKRAWVNLLNPIYLYAIYSYSFNYIIQGKENIKLPMLDVLGYKYLPSFSMNLNPFGSELVMTNYFKNDKHLLTGEVRIGDDKLAKSYGGGLSYSQTWTGRPLLFDANLDVWNQDELELGGDEITLTKAGWGGALRLSANFRLLKGEKPVYWHTQLGYKTSGYLQGHYLKEGLIWRIGLSFSGI